MRVSRRRLRTSPTISADRKYARRSQPPEVHYVSHLPSEPRRQRNHLRQLAAICGRQYEPRTLSVAWKRHTMPAGGSNIDRQTVDGFGEEWSAFDQTELSAAEQARVFDEYFSVFPF